MSDSNQPNPAGNVTRPVDRRYTRARVLAARVGVCAKTLHRWASAGHIHSHKVNARVVLFDEAEVLAFIERSRVSVAA